MTKAQAESAVASAGITGGIRIDNDEGSYDPATAKVCNQTPGEGRETSSTLFVSIRFCLVDKPVVDNTPVLVGVSLAEATKRAKTVFTGTIETAHLYEFDKDCKPDTVCMVTPNHWELNQEHTMQLWLNKQQPKIEVPE